MKLIEKIKELWAKIVAWVKGATNAVDNFILKYELETILFAVSSPFVFA